MEPFAAEADKSRVLHPEVVAALRASRLTEVVVLPPRRFDRVADTLDPLAIALVREAPRYSSAHLDSLFGVQGSAATRWRWGARTPPCASSGCRRW